MEDEVLKVFVSYAHKDDAHVQIFMDEFKSYAKSVSGLSFDFWWDKQLTMGGDWNDTLLNRVFSSDFALLLVSQNFFVSNYIKEKEFDNFLKRKEKNDFLFFPVFLKPTNIGQWDELARIQFFKPDGKKYGHPTITDFSYSDLVSFNSTTGEIFPNQNRDRYYGDLIIGLSTAITEFRRNKKPLNVAKEEQVEKESNESLVLTNPLQSGMTLLQEDAKTIENESDEEKVKKFIQLRDETINELLKISDGKLKSNPKLNSIYADELFEKILIMEKLDTATKISIENFRLDRENFKWHQRAQIVTALSLSLLNFTKIDQQKFSYLIDFLGDQEERVWDRALLALYLNLAHHHTRIKHRYPELLPKLSYLKTVPEIQESIVLIEFILNTKLYKQIGIPESILDSDFFNKPQHWFLPFYDGNKILEDALDCLPKDMPLDEANDFMLGAALPDVVKYFITLGTIQGTVKWSKKQNKNNAGILIKQTPLLSIPYLNLMSSYYLYINHFKGEKLHNFFESKMSIYDTNLRNVVLDNLHIKKIEVNDYLSVNNLKKAFSTLEEIVGIIPEDIDGWVKLANVAFKLGKYKEVLKAVEKSNLINENQELCYYALASNCYLNKQAAAIKILTEALNKDRFDYETWTRVVRLLTIIEFNKLESQVLIYLTQKYPNDNVLLTFYAWSLGKSDLESNVELEKVILKIDYDKLKVGDKLHYLVLQCNRFLNKKDKNNFKDRLNELELMVARMNHATFIQYYNIAIFNFYLQEFDKALLAFDQVIQTATKLSRALLKIEVPRKILSTIHCFKFYIALNNNDEIMAFEEAKKRFSDILSLEDMNDAIIAINKKMFQPIPVKIPDALEIKLTKYIQDKIESETA